MRDRLIELLGGFPIFYSTMKERWMPEAVERLADYLLANGVIVPPCKVGDTLYVISHMKDKRFLPFINEYEVTSISIKKKRLVIYHEMDGYIKTFNQIDFGKTVFLSKAEAERVVTDNNVGVK